jgi:hypothetical protein
MRFQFGSRSFLRVLGAGSPSPLVLDVGALRFPRPLPAGVGIQGVTGGAPCENVTGTGMPANCNTPWSTAYNCIERLVLTHSYEGFCAGAVPGGRKN